MSRYCPPKNLVFARFFSFLFTLTNKKNSGQSLAPTFFCQTPGNPATRQKLDKLWTWGTVIKFMGWDSEDNLWTKSGSRQTMHYGQILDKLKTKYGQDKP